MDFDTGPNCMLFLSLFTFTVVLYAEPLPLVIVVSELVCRMTSDSYCRLTCFSEFCLSIIENGASPFCPEKELFFRK